MASTDPMRDVGDGFTAAEIEATLHPTTLHKWQPSVTYHSTDINKLVPGARCVALLGRVVHIYNVQFQYKNPQAARGCLRLTVKDDTGILEVSKDLRTWLAKV